MTMKREPYCSSCGAFAKDGHAPDCEFSKFNAEARQAIDVIMQWSHAMEEEWNEVLTEMRKVGVPSNDFLKIGDLATIEENKFLIKVDRSTYTLASAISRQNFDIAKLAKVRAMTVETLKECRKQIAAKKAADKKAAEDRIKKVNETLPQIVDEFGADLMQYGPAKTSKKS